MVERIKFILIVLLNFYRNWEYFGPQDFSFTYVL